MKTIKIEIAIKFNGAEGVIPEAGKSEEDYTKKELEDFRKGFNEDLEKAVVYRLKNYIEDCFDEDVIDNLDELYIEDWEMLKDYGVEVSIKEVK